MIAIKLDTDIINILHTISKHPVLNKLILKFEIDDNYLYSPTEKFNENDLKKLIEEGLAFQI